LSKRADSPRAAARPRVVLLVDDKTRDLAAAALIAHHLDALGVDCFLEPLEAYRAVLGAYRPQMIVFNHLNASHLVTYSKRLAAMGVLTAVLPNEGIAYAPEHLRFIAGSHHRGAHIDWFFCWNAQHAGALREVGLQVSGGIEVVGVPRFDFYFEPWSRAFRGETPARRGRPRVLLCTNFVVSRYQHLPKAQGDKFFAAWKDRLPRWRDYWKAVEDSYQAKQRVLDFARALVEADRYELVLRPHPREESRTYEDWIAALPAAQRKWVRLDPASNITPLILDCDLEISCETCTTALEAWIAGKPTVELVFFRNPAFYYAEHAAGNTPCERPEDLPGVVERLLREGEEAGVLAARKRHLAKWCAAPDGTSSLRLARTIAGAVRGAPVAKWSALEAADRRRATKLRLLRQLGLAYHYDPLMPVKIRVNRGRYAIKKYSYDKSIKPRHVAAARRMLAAALAKP